MMDMVGQILDKLKELGIDSNTIVMYSTDNGAEEFSWPDGGTTPFRGEKNTNWEGGYRVPVLSAGPASSSPARSSTTSARMRTCSHLACHGGRYHRQGGPVEGQEKVGDSTYKVHLDGYNLLPTRSRAGGVAAAASSSTGPTTGRVAALRYNNWKVSFSSGQDAIGLQVWSDPSSGTALTAGDQSAHGPVERAEDEGMGYTQWMMARACHDLRRRGPTWVVAAELPRAPAAPEARQLSTSTT